MTVLYLCANIYPPDEFARRFTAEDSRGDRRTRIIPMTWRHFYPHADRPSVRRALRPVSGYQPRVRRGDGPIRSHLLTKHYDQGLAALRSMRKEGIIGTDLPRTPSREYFSCGGVVLNSFGRLVSKDDGMPTDRSSPTPAAQARTIICEECIASLHQVIDPSCAQEHTVLVFLQSICTAEVSYCIFSRPERVCSYCLRARCQQSVDHWQHQFTNHDKE